MTARDLIALREKVAAGGNPLSSEFPFEISPENLWGALRGSRDAALALHKALLSGWRVGMRMHEEIEGTGWHVWMTSPDYHVRHYFSDSQVGTDVTGTRVSVDHEILSRAILLAILDALIGETDE